jgi:hypothetical protein
LSRGTVEFLGHKAHVIVDGIHPDTVLPYYWLSDPLWEVQACRLPILTSAVEARLVARIAKALGGKSPDAVAPTTNNAMPISLGPVPIGWRNVELFSKVKDAAFSCDTRDNLSVRAQALNQQWCSVPLDHNEISRIVRWVWDRKTKGELWCRGGEARAVVTRSEWGALDPDAAYLLIGLRQAHQVQAGKLFAVASTAMAKSFKMGPRRITRARDNLIKLGLLEQVGGRGRRGHPTRYRFSPQTPQKEHDADPVEPA